MVDGGEIILVKGASGSGKSTRGYYFLTYLESIGIVLKPFNFINILGQQHTIGVCAEEFGIVFIGKWYESGGVKRWQGYDAMTSRLHKTEGLLFLLQALVKRGLCPYIDGAGTTATWKLRPYYLCGELGITNILHIAYNYREDQYAEYKARIAYRSGKEAKGDAMWRKNKTFVHDMQKAEIEAKDVNDAGGNALVLDRPYDAPIWDLGERIFTFFGLADIVPDYKNFCLKNQGYLQQNSFETFNT